MNSLPTSFSCQQTFHKTHPSPALPSDLRASPWVFPYSESALRLDSRLASTFLRALPSTSQRLPVSLLSFYWFLPLGLGQPTPVFSLGHARDRGGWRATGHGVAKSQIWLRVWTTTISWVCKHPWEIHQTRQLSFTLCFSPDLKFTVVFFAECFERQFCSIFATSRPITFSALCLPASLSTSRLQEALLGPLNCSIQWKLFPSSSAASPSHLSMKYCSLDFCGQIVSDSPNFFSYFLFGGGCFFLGFSSSTSHPTSDFQLEGRWPIKTFGKALKIYTVWDTIPMVSDSVSRPRNL